MIQLSGHTLQVFCTAEVETTSLSSLSIDVSHQLNGMTLQFEHSQRRDAQGVHAIGIRLGLHRKSIVEGITIHFYDAYRKA